ncbi:MAG TPA: hypothetical protein VF796_06560, partial [Humisphaera sp.]
VFVDQLPAYKRFVADVRLPSRTVLAEGPGGQKLTLNTVLRVGDFLEWLLETPFTAAQRDELQAYLVDAYKRADAGEIAAVQEVHKVREQLDKLTPEQRDFAREAARAEAMKEWREEARKGDRLAKRMVEIYDAGRAALATGDDGDPPLTRQAADASLEAVYFMASKVAFPNGPESHPTPAQLDAWAKDLAAQYKEMPRAKKDDLAGMTALWAKLRLAWPEMSAAERAAVLEEWAKLPLVKQTAEQVKANRPTEEARRLSQIYRNYDAHQSLLYMGAYNLYQRPLYSYR